MTRYIVELRNCMLYYIPEEDRTICASADNGIIDMKEDELKALMSWCRTVTELKDQKKWEREQKKWEEEKNSREVIR